MAPATNGSPLEQLHPRSLKHLASYLEVLLRGKLWLQIIVGMLLGIGLGVLLGPDTDIVDSKTSAIIGEWVALPGYFFLAVIQMIVVPLVFSSIIRGIASNQDIEQLRKTGLRLLIYFLITTAVAVVIGISVGKLLRPGDAIDPRMMASEETIEQAQQAGDEVAGTDFSLREVPQNLVDVLPKNPIGAMANGEMLQVVLFAFIIGLALVTLPTKTSKPMLDLLSSLESVAMAIVRWVMLIAPLAVFGLMAKVTISTGVEILVGMGFYVLTVMLGFAILLIFFLIVVAVMGGRNPFRFLRNVTDPLLMAFSTDSSAATMPLSIKTAEEKLRIRPSTARFVIPIGATVNMSGSALYQGLATMFVSQIYGMDLPISALLALIVTIIGASIGTPATPGVGIIVLATVLTSAGVPLGALSLIIGVDRILEMMRTMLNVMGDLVGCVLLDRGLERTHAREEELAREDEVEHIRQQTGEATVTT